MAPFRFNLNKAIQAAAYLLKKTPDQRDSYMRVLKLLYLADRRSLADTGRPITGDQGYMMDLGPVPSRVLDIIKNDKHVGADAAIWKRFITTTDRTIRLHANPGVGKLCRYETRVLDELAEEHSGHDRWALSRITHDLPECVANEPTPGSSKPIPLVDTLQAVDREDDLAAIEEDAKESAGIAAFFEEMGAPCRSPLATPS